jgi:hypothetical protein
MVMGCMDRSSLVFDGKACSPQVQPDRILDEWKEWRACRGAEAGLPKKLDFPKILALINNK